MITRYTILLAFIVLVFFSCKNSEKEKTKLAQVHSKVLYLEDIADVFPENSSKADSNSIIKNKIDNWVNKQVILNRAELSLKKEKKSIDKVVEDYRESLLIEKYKQKYLEQKIDTQINDIEIRNYYNNYYESFVLNEEIVKAHFFKIDKDCGKLKEFRTEFINKNEKELLALSINDSIKYYNFNDKWYRITEVLNLLPTTITNHEAILKLSKKFETRDDKYIYFLIFNDYKLKGNPIPFEKAKNRIRIILLNKRKKNIITKLEKNIYQSDIKNNNIKIFTE